MNKVQKKIYVITGSNKGIGLGLVENLCKRFIQNSNFESTIFATTRQEKLGLESIKALSEKYPTVKNQLLYHQLDITNNESIAKFVNHLKTNNIKIDILFNNAGILIKDNNDKSNIEVSKEVLNTNYHSVINLTNELIPFINPYGHIINVSSKLGTFMELSKLIRYRFDNEKITMEELDTLEKEYYNAVENNKEKEQGWLNDFNWPNSYCISKVFLNAYSRQLAWKLLDQKIRVNVFTPGWCRTDMGGSSATNDIYQGAETGVMISEMEDNDDFTKSYCKYYASSQVADW